MQDARSERAEQRTSPSEDVSTSISSIGDAWGRGRRVVALEWPVDSAVPLS
jgi:hypothetical protein